MPDTIRRRFTLADEDWPACWQVTDLDVNVMQMCARMKALAPKHGRPAQFGPCGVAVRLYASSSVCNGSVIVTQAEHDGAEWIHASIARENHMPTYSDLADLKYAVFGENRFAFQVFPAANRHVNIHARALHLWGRADGANPLPDFGSEGTI